MIELLLAAAAAAQCPSASEQQVRDAFTSWLSAYRGRDLEGTMAIFHPDVRFQFQGMDDVDWAGLRDSYRKEFAATVESEWRPVWDEVLVSGDIATAFASWSEYVGESKEPRAVNRAVDVFRRGEDCRWRIVRSLNYPAKPAR